MRGGDSTPLFPRNFSATVQKHAAPAPKVFLAGSVKQEGVAVNRNAKDRIFRMHADCMKRDKAARRLRDWGRCRGNG